MEKIAIYPGTFDPITLGHLDVIEAGAVIFDKVIVAILINPRKKPMFSEEKRLEMIAKVVKEAGLTNIQITSSSGLTVELAQKEGAIAIIRGLRLVMDFEAELDRSFNYRILSGGIHTVLIPPLQEHIHIRASTVRELLLFGRRDLDAYVPKSILDLLSLPG